MEISKIIVNNKKLFRLPDAADAAGIIKHSLGFKNSGGKFLTRRLTTEPDKIFSTAKQHDKYSATPIPAEYYDVLFPNLFRRMY